MIHIVDQGFSVMNTITEQPTGTKYLVWHTGECQPWVFSHKTEPGFKSPIIAPDDVKWSEKELKLNARPWLCLYHSSVFLNSFSTLFFFRFSLGKMRLLCFVLICFFVPANCVKWNIFGRNELNFTKALLIIYI